ncbi:MAG: hypothetical protein DRH89_10050, partial [Candidatus Cloacimonadota bacterium]
MEQNSGERLKHLVAKFVLKYNYWGYLFSRIRRKPARNFGSIMGVMPEKDGTVSLIFEPDLLAKTEDREILRIIEHEGMHLLNKHISRLLRILSNEISEMRKTIKIDAWNVAADCSVNVQANIREPIVIAGKAWPPQLPEKYGMEEGKVTEEYFFHLLKNRKSNINQMCQHCKHGKANEKKEKGSKSKQGNQPSEKDQNGKGTPCDQNGPGKSCPGSDSPDCPANGGFDNHKGWVSGAKGVPDL